MLSISAVVLTKNEEKNISDCLKSLQWCEEIIVIDDDSNDKTTTIAEHLGAKVVRHAMLDFANQRNFGLTQAKGKWVLFVDADERVSEELKGEIKQEMSKKNNQPDGYFIRRRDILWGKELQYGEAGNIALLRLAKRDSGEWNGKVHERWIINGKLKKISSPLLHFPHQTIKEFLHEINYYSGIRAHELYEEKINVNMLSILLYPKAKFILNYFIKLGFLDGANGLIHAIMMSLHSFLVRGKLWLEWKKN